jgi:zinc and cadmium transporter
MASIFLYVLGSTVLLVLVATVIVRVIPTHSNRLSLILSYFSALAAGSLLGDAFIYLIPKSAANGWTTTTTIAFLVGVFVMIITEQLITWDDVRRSRHRSKKVHAAVSNMFGFTAQSFIDGLIIASAYLISTAGGVATFLAVAIHQIPQEISNFVILRRAGIKPKLANQIGSLAVVMSFVGALVGLLLPAFIHKSSLELASPFTAGVFCYIALAQLIPGMLMEKNMAKGIYQILLVLAGLLLIAGIKYSKHLLGAFD